MALTIVLQGLAVLATTRSLVPVAFLLPASTALVVVSLELELWALGSWEQGPVCWRLGMHQQAVRRPASILRPARGPTNNKRQNTCHVDRPQHHDTTRDTSDSHRGQSMKSVVSRYLSRVGGRRERWVGGICYVLLGCRQARLTFV
jgi:hypothetical protein